MGDHTQENNDEIGDHTQENKDEMGDHTQENKDDHTQENNLNEAKESLDEVGNHTHMKNKPFGDEVRCVNENSAAARGPATTVLVKDDGVADDEPFDKVGNHACEKEQHDLSIR